MYSTEGHLRFPAEHEDNEKSVSVNMAQDYFNMSYSCSGFAFFATFKQTKSARSKKVFCLRSCIFFSFL